jgi:hypothetical protein
MNEKLAPEIGPVVQRRPRSRPGGASASAPWRARALRRDEAGAAAALIREAFAA